MATKKNASEVGDAESMQEKGCEVRMPPLTAIAQCLVRIAEGDSMVAVRALVGEVFPADKAQGEKLVQQLVRLSAAAEAVVTLGKEQLFKL